MPHQHEYAGSSGHAEKLRAMGLAQDCFPPHAAKAMPVAEEPSLGQTLAKISIRLQNIEYHLGITNSPLITGEAAIAIFEKLGGEDEAGVSRHILRRGRTR